MAGYPESSEQASLMEVGGWVLAGAESFQTADDEPEVIASEIMERKLSVEASLALPHVTTTASTLDLVLSVLAPTAQGKERAPLRLVAVLDKSGSMHGEKLRLVVETIKFMLQHLTERDALGLIAFDTEVQVLAPLTWCTPEGRTQLETVISRLRAGSQTNLSGGLLRGLELHGEAMRETARTCSELQRVSFGNKYRKLASPQEGGPEPPAGCEQVHEWTMELVFENDADAALIEKVVYKLHHSFANNRIEVLEPPFRLTRVGWGLFKVRAEVHLHDGRTLDLDHELCFKKAESFQTKLLALKPPAWMAPVPEKPETEMAVVRSTFLFTDGAANVGIQKSEQLCSAVSAMSQELGSKQCTISTFGFGADHSADLLRNIAETGQGVYCFIENAESIGEAFGEALGGLLSVTHQNVRLSLELAPGVKLVQARTSYPVEGPTCHEDGRQSLSIDVRDLFAEERRDILLEVSLPEAVGQESTSTKFGAFHARGFSVLSTCLETTDSWDLVIQRSDASTEGVQVNAQVERHRNRYLASEALDAARAKGRCGDLAKARKILQAAAESLAKSSIAVQGCSMTAALLADVYDCLNDLRDDHAYTSSGSKKMAYIQMAHEKQRTCSGTTSAVYCNSAGFAMKSASSSIR